MSHFTPLQQDFQNYLHSGHAIIKDAIIDTKDMSAQTRLQIYRNAYQSRLIEALASNFPCLKTYLGEEAFHQIGLNYIASHPSTYHSIRWYGGELVNYLKCYYGSEFYFLAELAQFEWNMTMAFDAADVSTIELVKMTEIPAKRWGVMVLKFHPSLYRMNFLWNVVDLWEVLAKEQAPKEVIQNPVVVSWVLWRHAYLNRFYSLSDDESWAMDSMLKGHTFGELCEGLCQWHDEETVGMRAASLLKSWIESGLLSDILF